MLLRTADDGRVLGVLWHYTCHPTAVVPNNVISSDFPGAVRLALRDHFGAIPYIFVSRLLRQYSARRQSLAAKGRFARTYRQDHSGRRLREFVSDPFGRRLGALEPESRHRRA